MSRLPSLTAVYPGTFDPMTLGHADLMRRASRLFERLIIAVAAGHHKRTMFTIAERLKEHGYATLCVGKWHVGDQPDFLPTRQGFDRYFGIPYSNDMQIKSTQTGERVVPSRDLVG